MSEVLAPRMSDPQDELPRLITSLREIELRLEDLTGGEVDAVADQEGRPFLLRRAHEQLHHIEIARQAAILNALPAHIALLDTQGVIVSVNKAWQEFALGNDLRAPSGGVGANYLGVCDTAFGSNSAEARQVADGIRSVLSGARKRFSTEYPCHSPTVERWFLLTVTPLGDALPQGAVVMHVNISDRKRGEDALRRFRGVMDTTADGIFLVDRETLRYVDVNATGCRMLGYSREELLTLGPMQTSGLTQAQVEQTYDAVIAGRAGNPFPEVELRRKDGSRFLVEVRREAHRIGSQWIIVGVLHDVTERRKAQAELRASEREQRQLAQSLEVERSRLVAAQRVAKVGSWDTDLATMEVLWSDEVHRIFQTDPASFRPRHKSYLEFVHPGDRARVEEAFDQSLDKHTMFAVKHRLALRDGTEKFVEERWHVVFDESGTATRVVGTCQDITESEQTSSALIQFEERLSLATRSARLGIWDWDVLADVTVWDGQMRALHGIADDDYGPTYEAWRKGLHPEDRERAEAEIAAALAGDEDFNSDFRVVWPNGEIRHLAAFGTVKRAEDGSAVRMTGVNWDITESKDIEARVGRLNRVHEIRSKINALIVRVGDRDELFRESCRIAVEQGGFRMALIAIPDRRSGQLHTIATAGKDEQLLGEIRRIQSSSELAPATMVMQAFTDKRALVANHSKDDPRLLLSSSYAERGINSVAVLPLIVAGESAGVLVLYSTVPDFFHEDEMKLLTELTDDIVFAIDHIAKSQRLVYLNRVYAMLSGINALVARVSSKDELFSGACRVAVEQGGFRVAMLGLLDDDDMEFVAVETRDKREKAAATAVLAKRHAGLTRMSATVVRDKLPCISNDSQNDPEVAYREAHVAHDIHSMAVIPLIVAGKAMGLLALYADEGEFFHDEEVKILTELAADVAFAIDHIDNQQRLEYLAYYDSLTGLANRSLFIERANQCVRSASSAEQGVALVLVDLERFKSLNDSLGQPVGDELLRQVAAWLGARLVDPTLLARVGSDHFALMLPEAATPGDAARALEKLIDEFHDSQFVLGGSAFRIAAKFGVSVFPEDGADGESLFKHAEAALKKAKASGDRYLFYTQKMTESVARKLTLENHLRQALDNEEFVLHYQPKMDLKSGLLTSAEALIRWNDPRTGLVPPGMFIPILEETGLIYEVGRWALRKALEDYLRWRDAGLPAVRIAVNVSPLQLRHPDFVAEIGRVVGIDAHAAAGLELEITESMIMADVRQSTASLKAIRDMGLTIAIDDFGTGYSSLGYLSKLPVNTLKIDRSFVVEMTETPDGLSLVSTIISLAHSLSLKVVAEGVETESQANLLRLLKCDEMQGYLVSKPIAAGDFEARFLSAIPRG
jgi:diguanylate cyclase (GGDEF)-like protein/PAS domain S-box-containing protein